MPSTDHRLRGTALWLAFAMMVAPASGLAGDEPSGDAPRTDATDAPPPSAPEPGDEDAYVSAFADEDAADAARDAPPESSDGDEPYVSPFADEDAAEAADDAEYDDEPYVSPFAETEREGPPLDDEGNPLVYLESLTFENRVYFKESTVKKFVEHELDVPLDEAQLQRDARAIQAKYKARGYLEAKVTLRIDSGEDPYGRVAVFVIQPGTPVKLKAVHIRGNNNVGAPSLVEGLFSRPPELLSLFSQAGVYHKPSFDQDEQRLLANFYKNGHLEARVVGKRIVATRDMDGLEATFDVAEGPQYELITLTIAGDIPDGFTAQQLRDQITVKDGDVANVVQIQLDTEQMLKVWRDLGFAFARATQQIEMGAAPSGNSEHRGMAMTLTIDKGLQGKVRNIVVEGNVGLLYGTQDFVISQELVFGPGDTFSQEDLDQSQRRLMRLGYFSSAVLKPLPTDEEGMVDVEVRVVEQPTYLFSIAPAFIANEGIILFGIAGDRNLLGTGLSTTLQGYLSFQRQVFDANVGYSRILGFPIGVSVEAHRRLLNYRDFVLGSVLGGGVRLSWLAFWDIAFSASATVDYGGVQSYRPSSGQWRGGIIAPSSLMPQDTFRNPLELSVTLDKRDSVLSPRNGVFAQASGRYAGRFSLSGLDVLQGEANVRGFYTPFWQITLKSSLRAGYAFNPHGGDAPVSDRFFLGGFGSVRGYFPRSITPTRDVPLLNGQTLKAQVGGSRTLVLNNEIEFPVFLNTPFRGFVFVDAGNAWDDTEPWLSVLGEGLDRDTRFLPLGLFWSVGVGVLFQTPIAPLRFEWSVPLTRRKTDRDIDFFFGVGSAF